jgi:hypothetical protein
MRILFQHDGGGGNEFERFGLAKAFQSVGHEVLHWDSKSINTFDAFSNADPIDLFVGQTYNVNRAIYKNIVLRPQMKVILQCSTWGNILEDIDLQKYPILVPSEDEKRIIAKLKEETGKPDLVYQNYHDNWIEATLGLWKTIGCTPISNLNAADYFTYHGGEIKSEYTTEVVYIGGRWNYKGQNIDKYILPLLNENSAPHINGKKVSVKVFGNGGWNGIPQYLGCPPDSEVRHILKSSLCSINVHEPHSNVFGFDIVARPFKSLCAGTLCISDYVESLAKDIFNNNELPFYRNYSELKDLIIYYCTNLDKREAQIKVGYEKVMREHTYFNRAAHIFSCLNLPLESQKVKELHNEILARLDLLSSTKIKVLSY